MSNTNAAYEAMVRSLAAEMAANITENKGPSYINNEEWIEWFLPAARIAVKHMAEAFEGGYDHGSFDSGGNVLSASACKQHMYDFGLIPSPEHPEGTNHED